MIAAARACCGRERVGSERRPFEVGREEFCDRREGRVTVRAALRPDAEVWRCDFVLFCMSNMLC